MFYPYFYMHRCISQKPSHTIFLLLTSCEVCNCQWFPSMIFGMPARVLSCVGLCMCNIYIYIYTSKYSERRGEKTETRELSLRLTVVEELFFADGLQLHMTVDTRTPRSVTSNGNLRAGGRCFDAFGTEDPETSF